MRLKGKVAFITGGGGAMGGAQARLFAQEGAAVCVADIFLDKGQKVANDIKGSGGRAIAVGLDVEKSDQWATATAACERELGPINILCNNAGANFRVSFDDQTEEMWNKIIGIGLTGSFLGTKAVIPSMRRAGGGVIINMGSLASVRPGGGSPGYAAMKMGLVGLTRSAAHSYAKDKIRCMLVSPGHVDTPFIRGNNPYSPNDWSTSIDNPENYGKRVANTPAGRLVMPEDIAKSFLFVASDDASMLTGSNVIVDGGAAL